MARLKIKRIMLKVFQVYFLESQKKTLLEGFEPFFNKNGNIFLENQVMIDLFKKHENDNFEWFGVFSHKVSQKLLCDFSYDLLDTKSIQCSDFDILAPKMQSYPWSNIQKPHNPRIQHARKEYPGMWQCIDLILKKLNIPDKNNGNLLNSNANIIYTNSFLCKKNVMRDYIDKILQPTINLIKYDNEVKQLALQTSDYQATYEFPQNLSKSSGLTTWPHAPFILERMINVYFLTYNKKTAFIL